MERQLDYSLYAPERSFESKQTFASSWEKIKVAAAVIAFAAPVFAFFFPVIFMTAASFTTALIMYDLFNIADNLGDAARHSAQGFRPDGNPSHVEMMLESTLLANCIYQRMKA